jgi:ribonucleoside-triphosphate reductase
LKIIKKDGTLEDYDEQKIINAVNKAARRDNYNFTSDDYRLICNNVLDEIEEEDFEYEQVPVEFVHNVVEKTLLTYYPSVGKQYQQYRNYKLDFVHMMDEVYKESQKIMYIGDKENSNTDSAIVSTKRSLIFNKLNRELYMKFFLTKEELQAIKDGYIYVHDMNARRDTMNCDIFDVFGVLEGGFEMGNIWYNEPKTLDVAFDVLGDITLSAASCQYGGFTLPQVDEGLAKYAEKSYQKYIQKYLSKGLSQEMSEQSAYEDVEYEIKQGYQGWEYKFNTVASSRGDYPFLTITFGLGTGKWEKLITKTILQVHRGGQGKKGNKKPVLFPKLVFLYTDDLHGQGKINEDLFEEGIQTSARTMYPDWLSLDGDTTISEMYHKYGKVISPMGCRAFLSPWYERGGNYPEDDNDTPIFVGRYNIGAISLHLPMILAKSRRENKDFYNVLDYYLNLIRQLHIRTYAYLGEMRASTNPLAYCEGGFYGGHLKPYEKIKPVLKSATASFGVTALNELQMLYNKKSLVEDGEFALDVMKYINKKVKQFKDEDGLLYAIYGTPAENLCGLQVKQFRKEFGIVEGVSDKEYVSNSFHCGVWEDISTIEKQDLEERFWKYFEGGRIQYCKYPIDYNLDALRTLIRRAMKKGFYEGVNLSLAYCNDCGHEELSMDVCPKCGSSNLTKIERMNGYLSYSRVHGETRLNDAKMSELKDRKSM